MPRKNYTDRKKLKRQRTLNEFRFLRMRYKLNRSLGVSKNARVHGIDKN